MKTYSGSKREALRQFLDVLPVTFSLSGIFLVTAIFLRSINMEGRQELPADVLTWMSMGILVLLPSFGLYLAARVRSNRLVIDGRNVNLTMDKKTTRMDGESICSIVRVEERGERFLVLVSTGGILKLPDIFEASLAEIEEDLRGFCPTIDVDEFSEEERRRARGERSVFKEGGPFRLSEGVACIFVGVFFAAFWSGAGVLFLGQPEPFSSLGHAMIVLGGYLMVCGYVGWRRLGGSPKRSFTLLTRDTLIIRGLRNVVLHVPSIVEVRPTIQGQEHMNSLRVMTRDGAYVLVNDLDLELPLKEFAGLVPPGWVDPTITFSEAWKMLGKPRWKNFWLLLKGEVTTISKYGVTRYLRRDVEALKVRPAESS